MDLDDYLHITNGKKNRTCKVRFKDGREEEGVYLGESHPMQDLGMVIRMTGQTWKTYANVGISDPNPTDVGLDALEIKDNKISLLIESIEAIEFDN